MVEQKAVWFTLSHDVDDTGSGTVSTSFHCLSNKAAPDHILVLRTVKYQSSGESSDHAVVLHGGTVRLRTWLSLARLVCPQV